MDSDKVKDINRLHLRFQVYTIRDILIEKGLTNSGEFQEKLKARIEKAGLNEETTQALLERS